MSRHFPPPSAPLGSTLRGAGRFGLPSRRGLLKGGLGLLASPAAFLGRPARAAPGDGPKRLIILHHSQGSAISQWVPIGTERDFSLPFITAPLEGYKSRCVFLTGLDNMAAFENSVGNAHDSASYTLFTGQPFFVQDAARLSVAGPTIEEVIAGRISSGTPWRRLDFGVGGASQAGFTTSGRFFVGPYDPVSVYNDPFVALTRIFGDGGISAADAWALRARRASVLDAVSDQLRLLSPRLDAAGRERLDAHAEKLRQLEARVVAGVAECRRPEWTEPAGYDPTLDDDLSVGIMLDIMVQSLSCDYSRVATFEMLNGHDHDFPWLWADRGGPIVDTGRYDNWHAMVHADYEPGSEFVYRWYAQILQGLLDRLAVTEDADGENMLDTSLVVFMPEFSSGRHWCTSIPIVLAGNLGGAETGRWLDFMPRDAATFHSSGDSGYVFSGATINQLWVSLLQIFGGSDESFGMVDWEYPTGPVPGLFP